jgi:hypothetical protein
MTAVTDKKSITGLARDFHQHPRTEEARTTTYRHGRRANFERIISTYVTEVFPNNMASCTELVIRECRSNKDHGRQNEFLIAYQRVD